ncbi:hAT family dimerization domain protein [Ilyonectria robusta]
MRMMERALLLRPALNTFFNDVQNHWETEGACERTKPAVMEYRLSTYDWKVIEILVKLLKPFCQTEQRYHIADFGSQQHTIFVCFFRTVIFPDGLIGLTADPAISGLITIPALRHLLYSNSSIKYGRSGRQLGKNSSSSIVTKLSQPIHPPSNTFEVATKQLQSSGVPGARATCGSFDEYFPVFEILLDYLESAIEGTIFEEVEDPVSKEKKDVEVSIYDGLDSKTRKLLKVFIKLGWKKLHKYYSRLTSTAYVGAVVFNPAKKWRLLDRLWSRVPSPKARSWRSDYEEKLLEIWETYKERDIDCEVLTMTDEASMDYIERRLARSVAGSTLTQTSAASNPRKSARKTKQTNAVAMTDDEYARYCAEDIAHSHHYKSRPIDCEPCHSFDRIDQFSIEQLAPFDSMANEMCLVRFVCRMRPATFDSIFVRLGIELIYRLDSCS